MLVLDNCEHVIDACAQLTEHLLMHCIDVRILAAVVKRWASKAEAALRVPSLSLRS